MTEKPTKATAPQPPYIPAFFEFSEITIALKEGAATINALRNHLWAVDKLRRTQFMVDSTIARLTKLKAPLVTDKIESVPTPNVTISLNPGAATDGTPKEIHYDISAKRIPNPAQAAVDTRPSLTKDGIAGEYEELENLYAKLAQLMTGLTHNAHYIDSLLRYELDIPEEITSYTVRSTSGVNGYIIHVGEPTTVTMEYLHR